MSNFKLLAPDLEPWFKTPLRELPGDIRTRVEKAYSMFSWDEITPDQRRHLASQYDYRNDPATESHQEYWFSMYSRLHDIQRRINEWSYLAPGSAEDRLIQSNQLQSLEMEEQRMKESIRKLERRQFPRYKEGGESNIPTAHVSDMATFSRAYESLARKFGASKEELAVWIFLGPDDGGLRAYKENGGVYRFYFEPEMDNDYVALIHSCVFDERELSLFTPKDRFLTGEELLVSLALELGDSARSFLKSKIDDGSLVDIHPIKGGTDAGNSDSCDLPRMETGLFSLAQIQEMESRTGLKCGLPSRLASSEKVKESPAARKKRLHEWHAEEVRTSGARGALKRTAERENITHQTLKKILDRKK